MNKRRLWLVALSLIISICVCFCLASCNRSKNDNKDDVNQTVASALAAPTVTISEDGKASWNEIANASGYLFKINGGAEQTAEKREVQLEDGQSIAVKAKGDGVSYTDSEWSKTETYTAPVVNNPVKLDAPTVTISEDGKASWNEIANASGYLFKINGGAEQTAEKREVQLEDGQSIAVKAKGDGVSYTDSEWSEAETYTAPVVNNPVKLDTPAVTVHVDGLATWGAILNASNYAVKIGETETAATETSVKLKDGETISVQAVGDGTSYLTGDYSAPKTYKAPAGDLTAPENLTVAIQGTDAGKVILNWNAVEGANGYKYSVNGSEQTAVTVEENTVTVDLSEIDASKLDSTWVFRVKAIGNYSEEIIASGDYSALRASSDYCGEVEFTIADDEIYTVAEILKIMNYYGEKLPVREFMVKGTIKSNSDGNAVLENGFTLFGEYVPELYLAVEKRLEGLNVTALGTLTAEGEVKGLSSYRSVDFDGIEENDRYALVIETLNAWDMLKEDSKIMSDFYLPVKLYGVNIDWTVDDEDTGAFVMDKYGDVTVTCPADGEEDILVMLTAILYLDDDHMYEEAELVYMVAITSDNRIQLDAPKINIDPKTGIATWNEVEHAVRYWYNLYGVINDDYSNWETNMVDITGYVEAGEKPAVQMYNKLWLAVKAIGDGINYKDSEQDPKQYNYYPETIEPDGTPLEFDLTKLTQTGELANPTNIFGLACGNSSVFESASASRVVLGNDDSNGAVTGIGFIKVGSSSNNGKITLNFNKKINGVVICARQWNRNQDDKISVNGSAQQTASKNDWGIMYFNFTASKASTTVEINTNSRVFIQSIKVYVAD